VPDGIVNEAAEVVPFGPTTSIGRVIVAVVGEACNITLAVPRTALVEEFVAAMVMVCGVAMLLGAVNRPLAEILPTAGLTDQVIAAPEGRF
jgi:hypothetical protein